MIALDRAIAAHLNGDDEIAEEATVWLGMAPDSAACPLVIVERRYSDDHHTVGGKPTIVAEFMVKIVDDSTSPVQAGELAELCRRRLEKDAVTAEGFDVLDIHRTRTESYIEHDGDVVYRHEVGLYDVTVVES